MSVSGLQITRERKQWARWLLIVAWRRVELATSAPISEETKDVLDTALRDAVAIAEEWGLDPQKVLEDEQRAREAARGTRQ